VLKLTAKIRLNANADQRKALLETIEQANACPYCAELVLKTERANQAAPPSPISNYRR
jgi:hypothetical protein